MPGRGWRQLDRRAARHTSVIVSRPPRSRAAWGAHTGDGGQRRRSLRPYGPRLWQRSRRPRSRSLALLGHAGMAVVHVSAEMAIEAGRIRARRYHREHAAVSLATASPLPPHSPSGSHWPPPTPHLPTSSGLRAETSIRCPTATGDAHDHGSCPPVRRHLRPDSTTPSGRRSAGRRVLRRLIGLPRPIGWLHGFRTPIRRLHHRVPRLAGRARSRQPSRATPNRWAA